MHIDFNLINIIILFGAIQGFILCWVIDKRKESNKLAKRFFILFLFSISFYNLQYGLLDTGLFKYFRPLHLFPFPYEFLIGIALYFYVKHQFQHPSNCIYYKREKALFLPALLFGIINTYWFYLSIIDEDSYKITKYLVDAHIFTVIEYLYLLFNITLMVLLLFFLKKKKELVVITQKTIKNYRWIYKVTIILLSLSIVDFVMVTLNVILNTKPTLFLVYPKLFSHTLFIYWIGLIGYTKPNIIFNTFKLKEYENKDLEKIKYKLTEAIEGLHLHKIPEITISDFASKINVSTKVLSTYINQNNAMNFSEYINYQRVESVKKLLHSNLADKYTIVTLAKEAGFSSKSSFYASFKKVTGLTPNEYKVAHKK